MRMMVSKAHQTAYCGDEVIDLPLNRETQRSVPVDVDRVLRQNFYPAVAANGKPGDPDFQEAQPVRDFTVADALNLDLMEPAPQAAVTPKPGKSAAVASAAAAVDGNK